MFDAARTYVTRTAAELQDRGAISGRRGIIRMVSRSACEESTELARPSTANIFVRVSRKGLTTATRRPAAGADHEHRQRGFSRRCQFSGKGMNSVSPGTDENRPAFHSAFACSIRSLREETKFHQI
jgi:hypothetical protein